MTIMTTREFTEAPLSPPIPLAARLPASLLLALLALAAGSIPLAPIAWGFDLIASFSGQALLLTLLVMPLFARRRVALGLLLACALVHLVYLTPNRAARTNSPPDVLVMIHNTLAVNPDIEGVMDAVVRSGADVCVLVEPNPTLVRALIAGGVSGVYPHMLRDGPLPDQTPWRIVLSRWPLEDLRTDDTLACVVRAPTGDFGVVALHPASPRDVSRWAAGRRLVRHAAEAAEALRARGLEVVLAGDLNAPPAASRNRALARIAGVRRCKPWGAPCGTFPASLPWPACLAIDDAWVSDGIAVSSWRAGPSIGSDHRSVTVGLSFVSGGL